MRCSQLSQERLELWTSNLAGTFADSIRAKGHKNVGDKGAWAYPGIAQFFWIPSIISETGKAKNFKFCTHIYRIVRNKSPLKISGKVTVGVLRDSRTFSGHAAIYRAHRAVIFAIAQLSCLQRVAAQVLGVSSSVVLLGSNYYSISRRQGSTSNPRHSVSRHQLSGTLCLQLQKVPLPSPLSGHIWKLNCSLLHDTTRSNISSASGASDSNSQHVVLPIHCKCFWHFLTFLALWSRGKRSHVMQRDIVVVRRITSLLSCQSCCRCLQTSPASTHFTVTFTMTFTMTFRMTFTVTLTVTFTRESRIYWVVKAASAASRHHQPAATSQWPSLWPSQ